MTNKRTADKSKLPTGAPVNVATLVEYADGSIVSRTIAETNGGTVTLFAFDQGQSLSEHTTPFDAIVQIIDGEAELTIGGERVCPRAGQLVIMPANIPHSVRAERRFKMLLTMVRA